MVILAVGLRVRLYKVDTPLADWHSWRQADTASVTRTFQQQGMDLFHPKYHDLSNIPSGKDNPQGLRMVEFPIYNVLHLFVAQIQPKWGIEKSGRITSVILSTFSILLLFLVVSNLSDFQTALYSSLIYATMPFAIYYSRVVLPEPAMICFYLLSFYLLQKSVVSNIKASRATLFLFSIFFFGLALLTKPYVIFFLPPLLWILYQKYSWKSIKYILIFSISFVPLIVWRSWIKQFPEGIPASDWLYNLGGIRFRPAWIRWLFGVRLGHLISGYYGLILLFSGIVSKLKNKQEIVYWFWVLGILLYFSVFAGGNVTHDYYQAIITPFVAAIMGKGISNLLSSPVNYKVIVLPGVIIIYLLMISLSWYEVKGYYQINNPSIIDAGKATDRLTPKDAKIIAPYNGDTAFLFQTNRKGWPVGFNIDEKIKKGASYYVSVSFDSESKALENIYETVDKNSQYIILNLTQTKK